MRRRFQPGRAVFVGLALLALCGSGCSKPVDAGDGQAGPATAPREGDFPFTERAREVGLVFHHFNGMSGEYYIAETLGPGAALFDYDNDGDLDIYVTQGHMLGQDKRLGDARFGPRHALPLTDRLYRNRLSELGRLAFEDVTESSGLDSRGYGMGVTTGDYDRDGHVDLYVTNFGPNALLRNLGDGTFEDVTAAAGADDPRWSTSAAFGDYDGDGWLDLIVLNYVDFTLANHKPCYSAATERDYCGPLSYNPVPDRLLRNRGDGTFEDVTARSQIARHFGAGLGIVFSDLDGDLRPDLYVANDAHPNQFWVNQGDGTFRDEAVLAGCAFNGDGKTEGSMGIDAGDFDGDGDDDLFMTHLNDETNTLYLSDGRGFFDDRTSATRLGVPSLGYTGFGTAWLDYDNDGWLDLLVVNGSIKTLADLARQGDPYPLRQRNQLFHNRGDGTFEDLSARAGPSFESAEVSRGAAFGDVDNDGDTDVVVTNNAGPLRLLVNEVGQRNRWVGLRVLDTSGRWDMVGARVEVVRSDGRSVWRPVRVAASYCSANDPRVLVGLGPDGVVESVRVHWPDGTVESWSEGLGPGRYHALRRGTGVTG